MIRYATYDDMPWIVAVQGAYPDVIHFVLGGDALIRAIDAQQIIINEADDGSARYAMIRFAVSDGYLHLRTTLTDPNYTGQGHARVLYQYLGAKYQLPMKYIVEAGSESEQIWAKRSDDVIAVTTLNRTFTERSNRTFNEYIIPNLYGSSSDE